MGFFSPHKRHANAFNYTPRFFDPKKEERDQRRRELCGESSADSNTEYTPGQYIRTKREARRERLSKQSQPKGNTSIILIGGVAILLVMLYALAPRIAAAFTTATTTTNESKAANAEIEEFNPYAPITIVPNDYNE